MTVEEGHVIDIDGNGSNDNNGGANKYRTTDDSSHRISSGVGRHSLFTADDLDDTPVPDNPVSPDRVSALSGLSARSKTTSQLEAAAKLPWYRGVTCKDVRDIMPTLLILLGGLLIMIFVIPYAFSSVIKQLEAEAEMNKIREERERNATLEMMANQEMEMELEE